MPDPCATCRGLVLGEEEWEEFTWKGFPRVQYDYRTIDGRLFSCVALNLEAARERRDAWLEKQR